MIRYIKKYLILITVLLFLPKQVFGIVGSAIISAFGDLLNFFINITGMLAAASGNMLVAVTDGSLIQFSYTNPATNAVVAAGLSVTQGLANGFLVIALVFISISVALKMEGYGGQKLFINLILAALLVNFAPILVGVVVDAANIVMGFFLQGISEGLSHIGGGLIQAQGMEFQTVSMADYSSGVAIIQIGLNIFIAFILALFSVLFLVRWFAIWIITILSPIAIIAWIHPYTKSIWKQWLQQLVQWSFVGVTAGFFLFLGMETNLVMINMVYEEVTMGGTVLAVEPGFLSFLGRIIPFIAVAIFFGMAFVMGLGTSAIGADKVIGYAEHKRKQAQRYVGQRVKKQYEGRKEGVKDWTEKKRSDFVGRIADRPWIKGRLEKLSTIETPGSRKGGFAGWAGRQLSPIYEVGRKAGRAGVRTSLKERDVVSKTQSNLKDMNATEHASAYNSAQTDAERVGAILAAHLAGNLGDVMEKIGDRVEEDLPRLLNTAERTGKSGDIITALPTYSMQQANQPLQDVAKKLTPNNLEKSASMLSKQYNQQGGRYQQDAKSLILEVMSRGGSAHMTKFIEGGGQDGIDAIEKFLDEYIETNPQINTPQESSAEQKRFLALEAINPRIAKWMKNNPATLAIGVESEQRENNNDSGLVDRHGKPFS